MREPMKLSDQEEQREAQRLRALAEVHLVHSPMIGTSVRPAADLLHELEVHQIELELQNEALRQAQSALEESRDRYSNLYEFAPVGYLTLTDQGLVADINLYGATLLGLKRSRLPRRFARFIASADASRWYAYFAKVLKQEDKLECELMLERGDGSCIWVRLDSQRSSNNGDTSIVRVVLTDVTERHLAEEAMRTAHSLLDEAEALSRFGGWKYDVAANRISWTNEVYRIYGVGSDYDPNDIDNDISFYSARDQKVISAAFRRSVEMGEPFDLELQFVRANGRPIWVRTTGHPEVRNGKIAFVTGYIADITERKTKELELQALHAELRQILEWQVALHTVAAMAHEVNQPLSSISALCEAAKRMLVAQSATGVPDGSRFEQLENALQRMAVESDRAGDAVRRLLDSMQRPDTSVEQASLSSILYETLRIARLDNLEDYHVLIDCAPDVPPVRVNRLQVEKVLVNLITNGIEAMRETGRCAGRIWVRAVVADGGAEACVTVSDEGPGIRSEMQSQIFHPFVTTKPRGIGMGLTISRALVEAQGGKLWYEAQNGPGAIFCFTVPIWK